MWDSFAEIFNEVLSNCAPTNYEALFRDRKTRRQNAINGFPSPGITRRSRAETCGEADYAHINRLLTALTSLTQPYFRKKSPRRGRRFHRVFSLLSRTGKRRASPNRNQRSHLAQSPGQAVGDPMDNLLNKPKTIARKAAAFLSRKNRSAPWDLGSCALCAGTFRKSAARRKRQDPTRAAAGGPVFASLTTSLGNKEFKPTLDKAEAAFAAAANHLWARTAAGPPHSRAMGLGEPYKPVENCDPVRNRAVRQTGFADTMNLSFSDGTPILAMRR